MVKCVSYGISEHGWFVQTCCGEEHFGQQCDCFSQGEHFTEDRARELAHSLAEELSVPVEKW